MASKCSSNLEIYCINSGQCAYFIVAERAFGPLLLFNFLNTKPSPVYCYIWMLVEEDQIPNIYHPTFSNKLAWAVIHTDLSIKTYTVSYISILTWLPMEVSFLRSYVHHQCENFSKRLKQHFPT